VILGLSFSHNATACLANETDGRVSFCCSEERFSRRKNEWGVPGRTLQYLFDHVADPTQITTVAVGETCSSHFGTEEFTRLLNLVDYATKDAYIRSKGKLLRLVLREMLAQTFGKRADFRGLVRETLQRMGVEAPMSFVDHHTAHAASAYYASPFDDALVITLDGEGDGSSCSCWHGRGGTLSPVGRIPDLASLGLFYKLVTSLLGFTVNRHEGKVMSLAAHGDPNRYYAALHDLLYLTGKNKANPDVVSKVAECHLNALSRHRIFLFRLFSYAPMVVAARDWEGLLNRLLRLKSRSVFHEIEETREEPIPFAVAADLAAAAQEVLEDTVLEIVRFYQTRQPPKKLALAGGVFANVRLNQRLLQECDLDDLYIHPGMGDEGLAMGAALFHIHSGRREKAAGSALRSVFLGPVCKRKDIEAALSPYCVEWVRLADEDMVECVLRALLAERIVGIVRGPMEYGPRALGHRSILADPTGADIQGRLNRRLKRTAFMPFAPTVLDKWYDTLFEVPYRQAARQAARFMTVALDVRTEWLERLPGVVHIDGTARPHLLFADDDPFFYAIVHRFYEETGVGCVLNTSFNLHEEPLVNTADEALVAFHKGAVDVLVLEDYLVDKESAMPAQPDQKHDGSAETQFENHSFTLKTAVNSMKPTA